MDIRLFHRRLFEATAELIPCGEAIVCAVSGGIDSMAKLHGLLAVNEIHERHWSIHVAHLDHGLRADSKSDAEFVESHATDLGLHCIARRFEIASEKLPGESMEEAARRVRYEFLEETATSLKAKFVTVGHHADDQAETVLLRMARGTGLRGLSGMPHIRPISEGSDVQLVRPMLGFTRNELAAYVIERQIPYRHDHTNEDPAIATRNRIRHDVLPLLREHVNPEITSALGRLADHARRADEAVKLMASDALRHARLEQSSTHVRVAARFLSALPAAVQGEVVMMILDHLALPLKEVGLERIDAVTALATGDGRKRYIELPGNATVQRQGRWIDFRAAMAKPICESAINTETRQESIH